MDLSGIMLEVTAALLWGSTDSISAFAARRIGAFRTTVFSQLAGLLIVLSLTAFFPEVWKSFSPLMIIMGACCGLLASVGYYSFYRGLAAGPVTLVSTISSGSSIVTLLLAYLFLNESLSLGNLIALGIIILGIIVASTNLQELFGLLSLKSRSLTLGSDGMKWAVLTVVAFGAMDFSIGLSAKITDWFLPIIFMRGFSLFFLFTIYQWTHFQTQVRQLSSVHLQKLQVKDVPVIKTRAKRIALQAENILGDTVLILSPGKHRNTHMGTPSDMPTMITSKDGLQNLRKSPLIDITNKLFPPVNLLPTRSASGILLAIVEGILDCIAVLIFSRATLITSTGITSVLASGYVVVSLIVGLMVFRERLNLRQIVAIGLILSGISLLALSPF